MVQSIQWHFATRRGHNSRLPEVAAGWNSHVPSLKWPKDVRSLGVAFHMIVTEWVRVMQMVFWPLTFKILDDSCALRRWFGIGDMSMTGWGGELPLLGRRARTRRAEAHRPQGDVRIEAAFEWMKTGIGWWEMGVILELRLPSQRSFTSFFGFLFPYVNDEP